MSERLKAKVPLNLPHPEKKTAKIRTKKTINENYTRKQKPPGTPKLMVWVDVFCVSKFLLGGPFSGSPAFLVFWGVALTQPLGIVRLFSSPVTVSQSQMLHENLPTFLPYKQYLCIGKYGKHRVSGNWKNAKKHGDLWVFPKIGVPQNG